MSREPLITPAEAGGALGLDPKTLTRWAKKGLIDCVTLPTGHRRYRPSVVDAILAGTYVPPCYRVDEGEDL